MSNEVFPSLPGLALGATKTPVFATKLQEAVSGREVRLAQRANPLWKFHFDFDYLNGLRISGVSQLETLLGFFMRHRGGFDSFLFEDTNDKAVIDQRIGTGNGANKVFQLVRTWGGFTQAVSNINAITNIKVGGVATTAYTASNGVVTFTTAPASGKAVTWTGSYFYRAKFADDELEASNEIAKIWTAKGIDLLADLGARL